MISLEQQKKIDELEFKLQEAEKSKSEKSAELATMAQALKEAKESNSEKSAELAESNQDLFTQAKQNLDNLRR